MIPSPFSDEPLDIRREVHDTAAEMLASVPPELHKFPRPIYDIAQALHFEIVEIDVPVGEMAKFHGCNRSGRIYVNARDKVWVKRFTIGHELGHAWNIDSEWECNAFAEAVLMPAEDVATFLTNRIDQPLTLFEWAWHELSERIVTQLVRRYRVGYNAMISALGNYGWIADVKPGTARLQGDKLFEDYLEWFQWLK